MNTFWVKFWVLPSLDVKHPLPDNYFLQHPPCKAYHGGNQGTEKETRVLEGSASITKMCVVGVLPRRRHRRWKSHWASNSSRRLKRRLKRRWALHWLRRGCSAQCLQRQTDRNRWRTLPARSKSQHGIDRGQCRIGKRRQRPVARFASTSLVRVPSWRAAREDNLCRC